MSKRPVAAGSSAAASPPSKTARVGSSGGGVHWKDVLTLAMNDPTLRVCDDDRCVVIRDKFPKARLHLLVLPKDSIRSLRDLRRQHVDLLQHMEKVGRSAAAAAGTVEQQMQDKSGRASAVRCGYHAVPSLSRLHLHVISQDFDSGCLKTKKHWNSFTTEYFVPHEQIVAMLRDAGEVKLDASKYEPLLKLPLRCHLCSETLKNVPALKAHIKECAKKGS